MALTQMNENKRNDIQLLCKQFSKTTGKARRAGNCNKSDAWSFLEHVDAPQWADLTVEEGLIGTQGDDSWFHVGHPHHQISLEDQLNKETQFRPRWACQGKFGQTSQNKGRFSSKHTKEGEQKKISISKGTSEGQGHLKKVGLGQSWPRSQVKRVQLQGNSSSEDESTNRLSSSEALGCSSSSSNCSSSWKKCTLDQEGSSLSGGEVNRTSSNSNDLIFLPEMVPKTSLGVEKTPVTSSMHNSCHISPPRMHEQKCNNTDAPICDFRFKMRFSFETCLSRSKLGTLHQLSPQIRATSKSLATTIPLSRVGYEDTSSQSKAFEVITDLGKVDKQDAGHWFRTDTVSEEFTTLRANRKMAQFQGVAQRVARDNSSYANPKKKAKDLQAVSLMEKRFHHQNWSSDFESLSKNTSSSRKGYEIPVQARHHKDILFGVRTEQNLVSVTTSGRCIEVKPGCSHVLKSALQKDATLEHGLEGCSCIKDSPGCDLHASYRQISKHINSRKVKQISEMGLEHRKGSGVHSEHFSGANYGSSNLFDSAEQDLAALIAKHNRKVCCSSIHYDKADRGKRDNDLGHKNRVK
eukprot:c27333_g1_i1 orf=282-2018(+)